MFRRSITKRLQDKLWRAVERDMGPGLIPRWHDQLYVTQIELNPDRVYITLERESSLRERMVIINS